MMLVWPTVQPAIISVKLVKIVLLIVLDLTVEEIEYLLMIVNVLMENMMMEPVMIVKIVFIIVLYVLALE